MLCGFFESAELSHISMWIFSNTGMQCVGLSDKHYFVGVLNELSSCVSRLDLLQQLHSMHGRG